MADDKSFTVFYCWQSDLKSASTRSFIEDALGSAIREINQDNSVKLEVDVDRDTQNVPGAPEISASILSKIDSSHAFVADVSIINHDVANVRLTPNPNVLLELGYALRSLGDERIVLVMNTAFGGPEKLPFDLSHRRVYKYNSPDNSTERASEKKRLSRDLMDALRSIIVSHPRFPTEPGDPDLSEEALQILKHAAQSENWFVGVIPEMGGSIRIQIDGLSLRFESKSASHKWLLAVESLKKLGFLEQKSQSGYFSLTATGYQYWEKISRKLL